MRNNNRKYYTHTIQFLLVLLFAMPGLISFSQKNDSATVDSAITNGQDNRDSVNEAVEQDDREADSVKKAEYNFYFTREEWTKDSFRLRRVPDSVIKALQGNDDFWYANKDFTKKKDAEPTRALRFWDWLAGQQWYRVIAWFIIIGGFITVLTWYLASSNVAIFRRRSKTVAKAETGEWSENIFDIDYPAAIDHARKEGNYRLAVRLMFLRLLKQLSERDIIQYQQGRTNFDYLAQVSKSSYYKDFFRLTRNYEYSWYGEFAVSPEIFATIKNDFENFEKQLN